jgi:LCP family protein required for cell wall assembly
MHRDRINVAGLEQAGSVIGNAIVKAKVPTLEERMNILLMGVDSNGINTQRFLQTRSDTMMLVSCDPATKRVGIVSIPRDSRVAIQGHGSDKINAAHALGGPELAVQTVKDVFQVPVDHYVVIDAQGLRKLFEVLGPVEVKVEKRMRYQDHAAHLKVALDPGVQMLTPEQAEEYVRFRHDARGDIGRIDRQQWFIRQVSAKLREPQVILKLPELFKLANDYIVTDLSMEDMARLATFGKDIQSSQVETAVLPGSPQLIHGGSYWVPDLEADAAIFNRLLGTPMNSDDTIVGSPNSAIAAEDETGDKPLSFVIKYPKGAEQTALAFQKELTNAGYVVRYRTKADPGDCAHEQLIQSSYRANDAITQRVRDRLVNVSQWPVVVAIEKRSPADFTVILSADTVAPQITEEQDKEAATEWKDNTGSTR